MSVLDLFFKSREERERLAHLRNLVVLMAADGKIEGDELALISTIASREGLSESDIKRCISNPGSIDFVAPESDQKRAMYLMDLIMLMMVDGDIDERERLFCKAAAVKLGYKPEAVDVVIIGMIAKVKEELDKNRDCY